MSGINVFLIEDEKTERESFSRSVAMHNKTKAETIVLACFSKIKELYEQLLVTRCDAIIIDINLGKDEQSGNEIIDMIEKRKRIPIIVHSGKTSCIENNNKESLIYKVFTRGCDHTDIIEHIIDVYNTGYTRAISNNGVLDDKIQLIYRKNFRTLTSLGKTKNPENRILRVMASMLHESLRDIDGPDYYTISETYLIVGDDKSVLSGDIVKLDNVIYVVLTPRCTIYNKLEMYTLVEVDTEKYKTEISEKISNETELNNTSKEKLQGYLSFKKDRFHVLPKHENFIGGIIDFQKIMSVKIDDMKKAERIFKIVPPVYSNIQARFGRYYSRQGQANYDLDDFLNAHEEN